MSEQELTERINGLSTLINAQFKNVHDRLDDIKEQTTKTNGRVTAAEKNIEELKQADITHISTCPIEPRVRTLEDHDLSQEAVKKTFSNALTKASIILGMFATIITLILTLG